MRLSYGQKKRLRKTSFAIPSKRKYPIPDIAHGRNALARVSASGTTKERQQVRRNVYRRYPSLKP